MSVHTLIVEILDKNNPLDVYGVGPLDLELRLANGQCSVKGCRDGELLPECLDSIPELLVS